MLRFNMMRFSFSFIHLNSEESFYNGKMSFYPSITSGNSDTFLFGPRTWVFRSWSRGDRYLLSSSPVFWQDQMFPWKKELKIKMGFSCFLTLAVLPHGGNFLWWKQRCDWKSKEALTVKVSHYLPFPTHYLSLKSLHGRLCWIVILLMAPGCLSKQSPFPEYCHIWQAPVQSHLLSICNSLWW